MKSEWEVEKFCDRNGKNFWVFTCTSCGFEYRSNDYARPFDVGFFFCPWCGTRLIHPDGEQNADN